jgi:hypothetical protein
MSRQTETARELAATYDADTLTRASSMALAATVDSGNITFELVHTPVPGREEALQRLLQRRPPQNTPLAEGESVVLPAR